MRFPHYQDEKAAILTEKSHLLLGEDPRIGLTTPTEGREVQLKMKAATKGAKAAMISGKNHNRE